MELKDKVAIVTGGGSGIGKAICELFQMEGALVVCADMKEPSDGRFDFVKLDVRDESQVKNLVDYTLRKHSTIDIACNNAGVELGKQLVNTSQEEWDRVLDTNLKGVFLVSKHVLPTMIARKRGAIVNTASQLGLDGLEGYTAYCASKAGVISLTKSMALEYAKYGIRVNCVCPGATDTPMVGREVAQEADPRKALEIMIARHPIGRLGKPEEIAQAVLFLVSEKSSFATGAALVVDGGYTAQ